MKKPKLSNRNLVKIDKLFDSVLILLNEIYQNVATTHVKEEEFNLIRSKSYNVTEAITNCLLEYHNKQIAPNNIRKDLTDSNYVYVLENVANVGWCTNLQWVRKPISQLNTIELKQLSYLK
jgi:hypothetical protein